MRIVSSDQKRTVEIGSYEIFWSLYSTVTVRLARFAKKIPFAMEFLSRRVCEAYHAEETAKQINMLRDALSVFPPEKAVYDNREPQKKAPWAGRISPVITSCANYYTTSEGKDLLFEIASILCYANVAGCRVVIEE